MSAPIINQPWEDVADDVTGAIEKAVQPRLKKVVDDIYSGLLDATQDYLKDNLAFNIASRIDCAEREASSALQRAAALESALLDVLYAVRDYLQPDGIGFDEAMSRILGAVDNSTFNPIILEAENGRS